MESLMKKYKEDVRQKLQKDLQKKNLMSVPQLKKIVVQAGVKNAIGDKKSVELIQDVLADITGQKPKVTTAKKSIASFKLREGDKIGLMVTLRGKRMYNFYEKLISIVLPRIKDFHGVKLASFDAQGNYTLGIHEYTVFPEIDPGKIDRIQGIAVTLEISAENKEESLALLKALGMPFQK